MNAAPAGAQPLAAAFLEQLGELAGPVELTRLEAREVGDDVVLQAYLREP